MDDKNIQKPEKRKGPSTSSKITSFFAKKSDCDESTVKKACLRLEEVTDEATVDQGSKVYYYINSINIVRSTIVSNLFYSFLRGISLSLREK